VTIAVGEETASVEPFVLVAVTATRSVEPMSEAVTV
jgi:hypothetical protein